MKLAMTVAEAAETVSLSQDTIRKAIDAKKLPAKKSGVKIIIRWSDLDSWVAGLEDAR